MTDRNPLLDCVVPDAIVCEYQRDQVIRGKTYRQFELRGIREVVGHDGEKEWRYASRGGRRAEVKVPA